MAPDERQAGDGRSERLDALVEALLEHETLDEVEAYATAGIPTSTDTVQHA